MKKREQDKIVLVSRDPDLTDIRKRVLENAGFAVIDATDESAVTQACSRERVRLILLGQSLSPSEKRQIWVATKAQCKVPILELYHRGKPELLEQNVFTHHSQQPDDFLDSVRNALSEKYRAY
jgi:DNA-binding NtrC family response regulator